MRLLPSGEGAGRHARIRPSHCSLHFTLYLVPVSCSVLLCAALLYAALLCSPLCYQQSCGTDFASNSPPCALSKAIGRPLPRCSEVCCAVRGAVPCTGLGEAAHGPFLFVLFLISVLVPEHVHVHLHGAQRAARGGGRSRKRRLARLGRLSIWGWIY